MKEKYMKLALEEAKKAFNANEVPIGAVIVCNDEVVSFGYNMKEKLSNPIKHAEIIAIEDACNKRNTWYLDDCDIYVTVEPCLMCFGAINESRIKNIYYGIANEKYGFSNYVKDNYIVEKRINVEGGILSEESLEIVQNFFKSKRNNV